MEIQAKLSFKHGLIVRIITEAGISIKDLARRSGWGYQNLLGFVSLSRVPCIEDREALFKSLLEIDPATEYEEVFPADFKKICGALKPRKVIKEVKYEDLLHYQEPILIDGPTEDAVLNRLSAKKVTDEALKVLTEKQASVVRLYYGLAGEKPRTFEEIADVMGVTKAAICRIHTGALICMKSGNYGRIAKMYDEDLYQKTKEKAWQDFHERMEREREKERELREHKHSCYARYLSKLDRAKQGYTNWEKRASPEGFRTMRSAKVYRRRESEQKAYWEYLKEMGALCDADEIKRYVKLHPPPSAEDGLGGVLPGWVCVEGAFLGWAQTIKGSHKVKHWSFSEGGYVPSL